MTGTLDIRQLLREAGEAAHGQESFDFTAREFDGFGVRQPVQLRWRAQASGGAVRLHLWLAAQLQAQCVRCLATFEVPLKAEKEYDIRPEDLAGEYPEYPAMPDGTLDLAELAYGEVVMEAPTQPLCSEDCQGLCSQCGGPKGQCGCTPEAAGDPRWQALRDLLAEGE